MDITVEPIVFETLSVDPSAVEIISMRKEFSKTFRLSNGKIACDISPYAVHYKEDYDDTKEKWKDIDLTPVEDGDDYVIDKAPIRVIINNKNKIQYTIISRRTGHEVEVKLQDAVPDEADVEFNCHVFVDRVRLWKKIKHSGAVKKLKWKIKHKNKTTGLHSLKFKETSEAYDNNNNIAELDLLKTVIDPDEIDWDEEWTGKVYERLIDGQGEEVTPVYPISIDTDVDEQVITSTDDCYDANDGGYWSTTAPFFDAGTFSAGYYNALSAARFQSVPIPNGATIDTAYMTIRCDTSFTGTQCYTKLSGQDSDDTITFSTRTDYLARPRTTAQIDWDISAIWSVDTDYNTPEIKTIIQEIVDRAGWASNNSLVIFWEDDGSPDTANNLRRGKSYDGSATYAPKLHVEYSEVLPLLSYGMQFNKSLNQYLASVSSFTPPANCSVAFWLYIIDLSLDMNIFGHSGEWEIYINDSDNKIYNDMNFGSSLVSSLTLTADTLYHIVCTRASDDSRKIVVNGSLDNSDSNGDGSPSGATLYIGDRHTLDTALKGYLQDVRIYNRVLSNDECLSIYRGNGVDSIVNGLLHRLLLNEKSEGIEATGAGSIIDSGSQKVNFTPNNSPTYCGRILKTRRFVS